MLSPVIRHDLIQRELYGDEASQLVLMFSCSLDLKAMVPVQGGNWELKGLRTTVLVSSFICNRWH